MSFIKPKKIIAVTGTNGKTTTTTLIYKIIKNYYKNAVVAGNIGFSLSSVTDKINKDTVLVLELSSYQLEDSPDFRTDISVLLNITPDHIKHHKTMKNYVLAKANIFKNQKQSDFIVFNYADKYLKKIIPLNKKSSFPFNFTKQNHNCIYYKDSAFHIIHKNKKIDFKAQVKITAADIYRQYSGFNCGGYLAGVPVDCIKKQYLLLR
jgi:UDP-N-acetylmuramoylalanine--D-glutamate ligase